MLIKSFSFLILICILGITPSCKKYEQDVQTVKLRTNKRLLTMKSYYGSLNILLDEPLANQTDYQFKNVKFNRDGTLEFEYLGVNPAKDWKDYEGNFKKQSYDSKKGEWGFTEDKEYIWLKIEEDSYVLKIFVNAKYELHLRFLKPGYEREELFVFFRQRD
jgi:hypothetical protein